MEDSQLAPIECGYKDLLLADYKYRSESLWKNDRGRDAG
jgi:hypothetical protein